jgi:hypothetical protein
MSTHAASAPATNSPRFRPEHAVALITVIFALLGAAAVLPASLPHGAPLGTTCTWHGSTLVVSGTVADVGMSDAQFRVTSRVRIAGRARPIHRWTTIDVPAGSARRWTSSYRYARKGLVGRPINGCVAHVRTIPPPSANGDD